MSVSPGAQELHLSEKHIASLNRLRFTIDVEDSAFLLEELMAEEAKKDSNHVQNLLF